jgi:hypothetical protein
MQIRLAKLIVLQVQTTLRNHILFYLVLYVFLQKYHIKMYQMDFKLLVVKFKF